MRTVLESGTHLFVYSPRLKNTEDDGGCRERGTARWWHAPAGGILRGSLGGGGGVQGEGVRGWWRKMREDGR